MQLIDADGHLVEGMAFMGEALSRFDRQLELLPEE